MYKVSIFQALTLGVFLSVVAAYPFGPLFSKCWLPSKDELGNLRLENENDHDWNLKMAPNGHLLEFTCKPGLTIKGHRTVSCNKGEWSAEFPTCIELYCPTPPQIPNTRCFVRKGASMITTIGSTAEYRCVNGFELVHKNVFSLNCTLRRNRVIWNGSMPECKEKASCPEPGVSSDGRREGKCCHIGDKQKFSCNENYEIVGDEEIECLEGAIWNAPRPLCRPPDEEHCPDPPDVPNGSIISEKSGDYYVLDDDVMVKCNSGFSPRNGSIIVSCDEDYQWDSTFAQCGEVFCERPPDLANGTIRQLEKWNSTHFPYGLQLTPKCNAGFLLIGDSMRSCGNIGWSGRTPFCEVIRCHDPGHPEFGKREGHIFEIGSKVVFSCFSGYHLIGSAERYCLPNGQWSGELTRCDTEGNFCPDPGTPINGWKSGSRYDQGETVIFGCHAGFFLVGSERRICQWNHTWTGIEPICRGPRDFDIKADVAEKLILASRKKAEEQENISEQFSLEQEGLKRTYAMRYRLDESIIDMDAAMNRGRLLNLNHAGRIFLYFMFDASGSIANEDFQISIEFAKALVKKVGISEHGARAGAMTFSATANIEFLPMHYDNTDDVLRKLDTIQQSRGGTAIRKALTLVLKGMIPLVNKNMGAKGDKSVIFLLTDGKANMAGDPEQEAKELHDAGVEIYCIGVTVDVNQKSLHKIASPPETENDQHVFILQDYKSLAWVIQLITNGTIDYSQCGLGLRRDRDEHPRAKRDGRARIIGGRMVVDPWPWMAALYMNQEFKCGGSIIGRRWILTAAHCLLFNGEINIVRLGLTDVENSTYLQEFDSESFVIHEEYNPQNFDYDIALIKLNKPIEYNAYVRPICLPPKDLAMSTDLYKPNEFVYAIGWGSNRVRSDRKKFAQKPLKKLKELRVPIQSREQCRESTRNKTYVFTERMFCAGTGRGDEDTCKGDSGGPMMQSQMNEEGGVHYVQVGIVSWGDGCAENHTYGFYTHVHRLRDWIIQKMEI